MKIAVASQNRKDITGHTGRCRKFWIYQSSRILVLTEYLYRLQE